MASSFSTLRQRGYGTIYAIKIEGIPYIFTEGPTPRRVDADATPSAPSGYTMSEAFMVVNETTIDQELDRESAVARGKALPIILSWDVLAAEDILDELFRRPAYHTTLTANLGATDATINVVSAASFASSGNLYLGRELIKYTGKTGTTFTGCTRGYLGYKYKFEKDDPGSYAILSPTPHAWKGRFVTVYEHLVSPAGHILDSTWCEGDYQRELWKGFISEPPAPGKLGMTLRAMPLTRLAAQELGSTLTGETVGYKSVTQMSAQEVLGLPVYVSSGSTVSFVLSGPSETSGEVEISTTLPEVVSGAAYSDFPIIPPGVHTLGWWAEAIRNALSAEVKASWPTKVHSVDFNLTLPTSEEDPLRFAWVVVGDKTSGTTQFSFGPAYAKVDVSNSCYWMTNGLGYKFIVDYNDVGVETVTYLTLEFPLDIRESPYLVTRNMEGHAGLDFSLESTGLAVVSAGDTSEVMRWERAPITVDGYSTALGSYTVVEIAERMVGAQYTSIQQLPADLNVDGTFEVVAGAVGTLDDVAETLLQSSGTGERGSKDTLAQGFGMGIPEGWIDLDGVGNAPITQDDIPLLAMGKASFASIFSGWYQLAADSLCLRRNSNNVLQIQRAPVVPSKVISTGGPGFLGTLLTKSDIVVGGTSVPRLVVAPNQISIDTTAGPYESAQFTYNAVGRIQNEGVHGTSLNVPGGRSDILSSSVLSIMARGLGQSIIRFDVAPWIDIQVGDPISITAAHPLLFDWTDGTRMPSNVAGRVVGASFNMKTGEQSLTVLMDGLLDPMLYLCPVTYITNVSGNDITVVDGTWFRDGETVRLYNRGKESSEYSDVVVSSVASNVLTLGSSPPAWATSANATRVTYPLYTSASTDQTSAFLYVRSDKAWR